MTSLTVEAVEKADQPKVIATLVSAFIADPVERWLYPQSLAYLTQFPAFVAAFAGEAFEKETIWSLDEFAAVAIWLPPGAEADGNAIVAALAESIPSEKHADTFSVLEQMDAAHPKEPHWYLPWLGATLERPEPVHEQSSVPRARSVVQPWIRKRGRLRLRLPSSEAIAAIVQAPDARIWR